MWLWDFEFECGHCNRRAGITIAASSALPSNVEADLLNNFDNSITNSFPALPKGTMNKFCLQEGTTLSYADII